MLQCILEAISPHTTQKQPSYLNDIFNLGQNILAQFFSFKNNYTNSHFSAAVKKIIIFEKFSSQFLRRFHYNSLGGNLLCVLDFAQKSAEMFKIENKRL